MVQVRVFAGVQAVEALEQMMEQVRQPNLRTAAGIGTLVSVFIFGSAIFAQLQYAFDVIWGIKRKAVSGLFVRRLLSFSFILFFLCVFLTASIVVSTLQTFESWTGVFLGPLTTLSVLGLSSVGVGFLYWSSSNRKVPIWAAMLSGVITACLFEIGKELFGIYLSKTAVASAYGAAGTVVVFLMWFYYTSIILLVGAELCFWLKEHAWLRKKAKQMLPP